MNINQNPFSVPFVRWLAIATILLILRYAVIHIASQFDSSQYHQRCPNHGRSIDSCGDRHIISGVQK